MADIEKMAEKIIDLTQRIEQLEKENMQIMNTCIKAMGLLDKVTKTLDVKQVMKYESRIDSLEFQVNKIVENTSKYNGELPHIKERLNSHNECFRLYEGRIQKIEKDIKSLKNMQNNYDLV